MSTRARVPARTRFPCLALLTLAGTAAARPPGPCGADEFARRLADASTLVDQRALELRADELAHVPGALDGYFAALTSGELTGPEGAVVPLDPAQRRLLERTAALFDPFAVVDHVRSGLSSERDEAWRCTALELLGMHGGTSQLSLLAQLALDPDQSGRARDALREPFCDALAALLHRTGAHAQELTWLVGEAGSLTSDILRAVGRSGDPGGLAWLATWLGDPRSGTTALQELGRLASTAPGEDAETIAMALHPILRSEDVTRRRAAIRALGALRRPSSVPRLVRVLADAETPGERHMAQTALRTISGVNLPEDAAAWLDWFKREHLWFRESAQEVLAGLDSTDEARIVGSLQELSEHSLHRDRLAPPIAALLSDRSSPVVRTQACLALGRLRSERGLADLIGLLEERDPDLSTQAVNALHAITGLSLGAEPWDWRDALGARIAGATGRP